jgi:hypothetical protein
MFKATPNPPETTPLSAHTEDNSQHIDEAAERARNSHLDPKPEAKDQLFSVAKR